MIYQAPWRKQLQAGSFRGVPFYVRGTAQTSVGRRVEIHEYPQRDEAYPEDLGLKADAFTIEALVLGPDYFRARDALIDALKTPGPGTLIHPYYGKRTVTLASPARISETPDEGGLARFSLDFVEAGENVEPAATTDTQAVVDQRATAARTASGDAFARDFSVEGHAEAVATKALALATQVTTRLTAISRRMISVQSNLSDFLFAAGRMSAALNTLIRSPAALAQTFLGVIGGLAALASSPLVALRSYQGLFNYGSDLPAVSRATTSRAREADNQVAMAALVRRGALIEASVAASTAEWDTYDAAVAARDLLAGALDDEANGLVNGEVIAVDDALYQALVDLRAALVRDLTDRAIDAPRLKSVTLAATLPALVAAHQIHGDARRADELLARNPGTIRHPGFVPAGVPLDVVIKTL